MVDGMCTMCYADTDSFMLALGAETLEKCVKPDKLDEWKEEIVPEWFVEEGCPKSAKEPGLLKPEGPKNGLSKGWMISLSPKCYILADSDPCELEEKLADPNNAHRVYEILEEYKDSKYSTHIKNVQPKDVRKRFT
ncbi:Oidioi.mRNA.OKI2018_I69.XSR.g17021.t1.cds [Oikopleura dioica]|uniref:Oidioi.mRNA.OKI2018_I69.XSR.g17021.t1.cds n=1 Tax=Oikopleura dioica TaxID=34765 RepID=A0ABN7SHX3_OIKDI|nr:Oidioi.mRNA.OKI2018_I69.XSR.g17021.t1.cds [Oikopleura dioica]